MGRRIPWRDAAYLLYPTRNGGCDLGLIPYKRFVAALNLKPLFHLIEEGLFYTQDILPNLFDFKSWNFLEAHNV
jgi:hypothetical protein